MLLADVLSFLNTFFKQRPSDSDDQDLKWLLDLLLKQVTGKNLKTRAGLGETG